MMIELRSHHSFLASILRNVMLASCVFAGICVAGVIALKPPKIDATAGYCVIFVWYFIWVAITGFLIWSSFGRETVEIKDFEFIYSVYLGSFLCLRSKRYPISALTRLKLEKKMFNQRGGIKYAKYFIAFEHNGLPTRFLTAFSKSEADKYLEDINRAAFGHHG